MFTSKQKSVVGVLGLVFFGAVYSSNRDVKQAFKNAGIVPDLIDHAPDGYVEVKFSGGVTADLGKTLTKAETRTAPTISYQADYNDFYTLIMADQDAPGGTFVHWIIVNIPGDKISEGETKASYFPPTPPSGTHRYVVLVYKQTSALENVKNYDNQRHGFTQFFQQTKLKDPSSGNYFVVNA